MLKMNYCEVLKARDNFILAAIKAEDPFMKMVWENNAKLMNIRLALLSEKPVEVFNE